MKKYDWLRWVSFLAGVSILIYFLLTVKVGLGSKIEKFNILFFLLVFILPAITMSLLSLFKKFWWVLPFSVWFCFLGTSAKYSKIDYSEVVIVSSLILFFVPFINMVLSRKKECT